MNTDNEYKDILDLDESGRNANLLDTDFRAETIAAGWIDEGYDGEKIQIIPQGGANRGVAKDIDEISPYLSEYDLADYIQIKTNRDGIYDALPESIFHHPAYRKFNLDKEDIIDEIKRHRMEEIYARKFFQIFEVESNYALICSYLFETQYDKKISNSNYTDVFIPYWSILKLLQTEQRTLFMHTIPFLNQIRNNNDEIEKTMSALLEVPVQIENVKLPAKNADSFFESAIGKSRLGVDLVLGKTVDDGRYDIKVTVGPISAKKMVFFIETSIGNIILDALCSLFFSADVFVIKDFKVFPEDAAFILTENGENTFLGINTFI